MEQGVVGRSVCPWEEWRLGHTDGQGCGTWPPEAGRRCETEGVVGQHQYFNPGETRPPPAPMCSPAPQNPRSQELSQAFLDSW